jgi:hypothetical protein
MDGSNLEFPGDGMALFTESDLLRLAGPERLTRARVFADEIDDLYEDEHSLCATVGVALGCSFVFFVEVAAGVRFRARQVLQALASREWPPLAPIVTQTVRVIVARAVGG